MDGREAGEGRTRVGGRAGGAMGQKQDERDHICSNRRQARCNRNVTTQSAPTPIGTGIPLSTTFYFCSARPRLSLYWAPGCRTPAVASGRPSTMPLPTFFRHAPDRPPSPGSPDSIDQAHRWQFSRSSMREYPESCNHNRYSPILRLRTNVNSSQGRPPAPDGRRRKEH